MVAVRAAVVGLLLVSVAGAQANSAGSATQAGKPSAVVVPVAKPAASSVVKVPLIQKPLTLADFAGMKPRPGLAETLGEATGFIQNTPFDGQAATEKTEVWLGHTHAALYAVFVCYDSHPGLVRGHLARRENILKDDNVSILLDPFQDRRRGIMFQVNPLGVQADAAWTDGNGTDYSYDQVWNSEGRRTKEGWMAVVEIPFKSLRFREVGSDWGVVLSRNFPRNSEVDYWPRVAASVSGVLSQEGTLRGIERVVGSHNVQLNPYALAQNEKTLDGLNPLDPYFSQRSAEGTAGGEAKAVWRDAVVFDATVNPDFSDVESDQPQFTVDQRYPVYFPELRPFFLENANYFATNITMVYTRRIVRPEFGARITGKIGNTNVGFFLIDDRQPGRTVDAGDPLYQKRATFGVGRVAQDFGKNLTIGAMYTDEEFGQGWNRVGGLDFTWRATQAWTVSAQTAESSTHGSRADSEATIFPSGYSAGPGTDVQINRNGHAFNMQDEYMDYSAGFVTTVGFFQAPNFRQNFYHMNYQWFPKKSVVQSFGLETGDQVAFDHAGNRVLRYMSFDPFWLLPRNIVLAPLVGQNSDTVGPQNGYALTGNRNFTETFAGMVARGAPWRQLNFNLRFNKASNVNYNPATGQAPTNMRQEVVNALVTLQPIRQLTADETYLLDRDHAASNGQLVYESQVLRTKLNYQFTRAFSARMIVEYDSTLVNGAQTSLQRTKQVQTQALLTWLPHPGTAIYVGYNNDIQNLDRGLCNRVAGGMCDPNNTTPPRSPLYLNDGRQFFVKASYLLRF